MDYRKLDELNKLRLSGALTDEEFEREKQKLFDEEEKEDAADNVRPVQPLPMGLQESSYLALMNFLMLVPYVGWIIPIILWIMGKDASENVRKQGCYILNWYISWFIFGILLVIAICASIPVAILSGGSIGTYGVVGSVFWILPVTIIIGILFLAFPIIGGIKGLNGQTWKYPLSIPFLK
ncbi:DUF4870 domain-containing protein [uncultured Bacteroides sp.]|uniref:DUF4870 domain-containing protein n=1 Tax=uncultured Bacteroides sp. TaxID=162156 RepID=UPI0025DC101F|nr:DUF4870 domain-containing protein [uncultured Bacteroides sp.]